ncbi:MAG: hypothetical protein ABSA27_14445 [Terriglobales bacterium]
MWDFELIGLFVKDVLESRNKGIKKEVQPQYNRGIMEKISAITVPILLGLAVSLASSAQTYVKIAPSEKVESPSNTGTVVCVGGIVNCAGANEYAIPFAEIVANLAQYCKNVVIASDDDANKGKVDYVLKVDYDSSFSGGTSVMLFDRAGHVAYVKKTRHVHNAFKDMCKGYLNKTPAPKLN